MLDRISNCLFIFVLVTLFILQGESDDHIRIFTALFLSYIFSIVAFFLNWIDLRGLFAATVTGTVALGFGGWLTGVLLLVFFLGSSLLTRFGTGRERQGGRRNGQQVWANGFWISFLSVCYFLTEAQEFPVMIAAAIAVVNADTWATEIGIRFGGKPRLITNFSSVPPGTDGGVTLAGFLASAAGAVLIAFVYSISGESFTPYSFGIIAVSGFIGSVLDSLLGAFYVRGTWKAVLPPRGESGSVNNAVNWLTSGAGALMALLLIQIFWHELV